MSSCVHCSSCGTCVFFFSCFVAVTEETQSDDGDEISVHDESGTETTEAETAETEGQTIESSADSVRSDVESPVYKEQLHPPPLGPSQPVTTNGSDGPHLKIGRASNVAASRGLNINVAGADRRPRPQGLPASPRPMGYSPLNTPTSISGTTGSSSPAHTPK